MSRCCEFIRECACKFWSRRGHNAVRAISGFFALAAILGFAVVAICAWRLTWEEATSLQIVLPIIGIEFAATRFPFQLASCSEAPLKSVYRELGMLMLGIAATNAAFFGALIAITTHPEAVDTLAVILAGIAVVGFFCTSAAWVFAATAFGIVWLFELEPSDALLQPEDIATQSADVPLQPNDHPGDAKQ